MEIKNNVNNDLNAENFRRMKALSIVFLFFGIFALITDYSSFNPWDEKVVEIYKIFDIVLTIVSFFALIYFWSSKNIHSKLNSLAVQFTVSYLILWAVLVCGLDFSGAGFATYIAALLLSLLYLNFKPVFFTTLIWGSALLLLGIIYFSPESQSSFLQTLFALLPITIISTLLSYRYYHEKIQSLNIFYENQKLAYNLKLAKDNLIKEVEEKTKNLTMTNLQLEKTELISNVGGWSIDVKTMNTYLSKGVREIYEIEPERILPFEEGIKSIIPEHRPVIEKAVQECMQWGTPYELDLELITAKGNKRWVRTGGSAEIENDSIVKITGFLQDITKLKVAEIELQSAYQQLQANEQQLRASLQQLAASEQQLRANNKQLAANEKELILAKEKAEQSDRLKSAFLANMSHEIRTPMNGILGFTSLLQEPDLSNETKEGYIEIIQKSGKRMLNTVNDIIEISKIEAGLTEVRNSEIDVIAVVKNLLDFFQLQAQQKQIILSSENNVAGLILNTDLNKFESILTNLIRNAIKFTDKGRIDVSFGVNDGFVQFCVKDTGIGVPQNRIQAIFNRFEQADIEDTQVFQGSGLGLAIAKSYVEILGGNIWVESVEGEGSTFCFTLPYLSETNKSDINIAIESTEKNGKHFNQQKILIVEDDQVSADFLKIILENISTTIITVDSGDKAVEFCKTHSDINLVLMDIKMRGMDGFEATRRIREFNKEVIIIAQTAYALSGDKEKAITAGCNDYIAKPVKQIQLFELITKHLTK